MVSLSPIQNPGLSQASHNLTVASAVLFRRCVKYMNPIMVATDVGRSVSACVAYNLEVSGGFHCVSHEPTLFGFEPFSLLRLRRISKFFYS
jgi:hypothetical protein